MMESFIALCDIHRTTRISLFQHFSGFAFDYFAHTSSGDQRSAFIVLFTSTTARAEGLHQTHSNDAISLVHVNVNIANHN